MEKKFSSDLFLILRNLTNSQNFQISGSWVSLQQFSPISTDDVIPIKTTQTIRNKRQTESKKSFKYKLFTHFSLPMTFTCDAFKAAAGALFSSPSEIYSTFPSMLLYVLAFSTFHIVYILRNAKKLAPDLIFAGKLL